MTSAYLPCPDPTLRLVLSDEADEAARAFIDQGIKEFNNENSPAHRAARLPGAIRPLDILVRDRNGLLQGGLVADTFWDWMEVHDLWLPPALRRAGLGAALLAAAEAEALGRGCRHAHLKTFSFQARAFYEKQGYTIVGRLEDYPPGETFYWLRKELG